MQAPGFPDKPVLNKKSYAASLSYVGSARRITAWVKNIGSNAALSVLGWVAAVLLILAAWTFVTFWYLIVFGLFGVLAFPFRLMRRGQRKQQHVAEAQLATMQAVMLQQQAQQAEQRAQEADRMRLKAEQDQLQLRQQLLAQLNMILETRDTARGLIVNMSDVLFDTGRYTLRPGARENQSSQRGAFL